MEEQERTKARESLSNSEMERIDVLARPKQIPTGFLEDRRSVYWDNNLEKDWSTSTKTTKCDLTARQAELVKSKEIHKAYVGDRPTPIWEVNSAAKNATPTARIEALTEPKSLHSNYEPCKQIQSIVSDAAKSAKPTERIEQLAKAKIYAPLKIKQNSDWDWSEWESELTEAAKNASVSDRIVLLAAPKASHRNYREGRPVNWEVPEAAKKVLPSLRIQQLARPKSCSKYNEDHDANAWKVSSGAKVAQATPRVAVLAVPIPRKVRQKKVV